MKPNRKPATFAQRRYLLSLGYVGRVPLADLTVKEASAAIDELKVQDGKWRYSRTARVKVRTGRFRR